MVNTYKDQFFSFIEKTTLTGDVELLLNEYKNSFEAVGKIRSEIDNNFYSIPNEKLANYVYEWMVTLDQYRFMFLNSVIADYKNELIDFDEFDGFRYKDNKALSLEQECILHYYYLRNEIMEILRVKILVFNLQYEILNVEGLQRIYLIDQKEKVLTDIENTNNSKTTIKTQILILKELGVFEKLAENQTLTLEQKGLFISKLLNMNSDNAKDYVGNLYDTKGKSLKSPYNTKSIPQANEILNLIGLSLTK